MNSHDAYFVNYQKPWSLARIELRCHPMPAPDADDAAKAAFRSRARSFVAARIAQGLPVVFAKNFQDHIGSIEQLDNALASAGILPTS